jgi:hypothetical protein
MQLAPIRYPVDCASQSDSVIRPPQREPFSDSPAAEGKSDIAALVRPIP